MAKGIITMNKVCKKCRLNKPLINFYKNSSTSDNRATRCKDCEREGRILYYNKNKQHLLDLSKQYFHNHKTHYLVIRRKYSAIKRATDINFRLAKNIRRRMLYAIRNNTKYAHSIELLGCNIKELKTYLETKFQPKMTWNNYGYYGWHIDHIIPCSWFDLTDPIEQKQCFHYTNLQPMWAIDNFKKNDTINKNSKFNLPII